MCSHYEAPTPAQVAAEFGVEPYNQGKLDLWPTYFGPFIRRPGNAEAQDEPGATLECMTGSFGLIPSWAKDTKIARKTYNCRSETAAEKPSFRNAWKRGQRCILPASAIYEPDWRTGKAVPTRIFRADGQTLGLAALWDWWRSPTGEIIHSYTILTINAGNHELMRNFHKQNDEKRMVVMLPKGLYSDWLDAPASEAMDFMRQFPADRLATC